MPMSTDGQGTKCRRNIAENLNRLSRAHERYNDRQSETDDKRQTDGRASSRSLKIGPSKTPLRHARPEWTLNCTWVPSRYKTACDCRYGLSISFCLSLFRYILVAAY